MVVNLSVGVIICCLCIYVVREWFGREIDIHKSLGVIFKIFLNLSILFTVVSIIYSATELFSQSVCISPLVDSLLLITEMGLLIWLSFVHKKERWRMPSMKATIVASVVVLIVLTFGGVSPFGEWKENIFNKWSDFRDDNIKRSSMYEQDTNTNYEALFNQYRETKGLSPLEFTKDLNQVAKLRLEELYTDYSHYSKGGYNKHLAENIVMSTRSLSDSGALSSWQKSPGHNTNMLDSGYKYTGYAIGGGYAVQVFTEYDTVDGVPQLPFGWRWND